jgi:Rrf2 family protein
MPERFLLQILRVLVNGGVLRSTRGAEGGYCLARPPNQISILQIVEAFDSPLEVSMPAIAGFPAGARNRVLATLRDASQAAREQLQKLTIADLLHAVREIQDPGSNDY